MNRISNFLRFLSGAKNLITESFRFLVSSFQQLKTKNLKLKTVFIAFFSLALFAALPAIAVDLPRTGQTTCYDASGNVISCAGTGQDGEIQAGAAWPSPRFADNGDQTITDNLTGLMWTKDAGTPTVGSCTGGTKTWQGALDYVACLNSNNYLSHNDWRLPNINEMESLVDLSKNNPALPAGHPFTSVQSSYYWSSSTYAVDTGNASLVSMGSGFVNSNVKSFTYFYVWPVRAGQSGSFGNSVIWRTGQTTSYYANDDGALQKGVSWPSPRFADNGNTVTDGLTGLIWTKDANAPGPSACSPAITKTWQAALDYVTCLNTNNYLGYSDWRLPNRKELYSLTDFSKYSPSLQIGHPFSNVQSVGYWSSSTFAFNTGYAWGVDMGFGIVGFSVKSHNSYVWPVRAGTVTPSDTTPPTGSISINSGATYTNSISATLTLTCTDSGSGCSQMQFSNDNVTYSTAETYATSKSWTLTSGDGTKTVYAKFKDTAGNWSSAYSDTIGLDGTAPATTHYFVTKWGMSGSSNSQFNTPYGIAIDNVGNVYVADSNNHRIQKFSSDGTYITQWGTNGSGNGQFSWPRAVAVDSSGYVYVVESGNNRVQKFDSNGNFITKWGGYGYGNGQFDVPFGIAVDSSGNVYVAGGNTKRIEKFDSNGNFITNWAAFAGTFGAVTVDSGGNVYVTSSGDDRVKKFDSNGNFITQWGSSGTGNGQLDDPRDVAVDIGGNVYVTDMQNNRVQKFDSNGNFITKWGGYGTGDGEFWTPFGIEVDSSGNVYVVDSGNSRIQKFGPAGSITINSGSTYTNSISVTISLTCSDSGSGCAEMQFSNDNVTYSTAETYATSKSWTLTSGEGTKTVYVKFKDNAGNWSAACSDTIILGTPNISSSPASINFGSVNVNTTTTQTITFTNTGTADLTASKVEITGTDSGMFTLNGGTCQTGVPLASNSNCILIFTFRPLSAGAKAATFTVYSDAVNDPDIDIPLSGTGAPQYTLNVNNNPSSGGMVTGTDISCPEDCTGTYNPDTALTLTATANNGYTFGSWTGCDSVSGNTCDITMYSDKTVTAVFISSALYVVWSDDTYGNNEIFLKKSIDGGNTWTFQRLTTNTGNSQAPVVAASGNDVYVVWQDDTYGPSGVPEIFLKKSTDGGNTWAFQRLTTNTGNSQVPAIAVNGNEVYVVWQDDTYGNNEIFFRKSTDGGNAWMFQRLTNNTGNSQVPAIAVNGNEVYVVWQDDTYGPSGVPEIFMKRSADSGATWQFQRLTTNAGYSGRPSMVVDGGNIYVVWPDDTYGPTGVPEIFMKKSIDGGNTWAFQRITTNTGYSGRPSIALSSGNLYLVWEDNTYGNNEIFLKKSIDGGNAWTFQRLTNNIGVSMNPSIRVNGTDVYTVWQDDTYGPTGVPEIFMKRSADSGATWQFQRLTTNTGNSVMPAMPR